MRNALDRSGPQIDRLEADVGRDDRGTKREQAEIDRKIAASQRQNDKAPEEP